MFTSWYNTIIGIFHTHQILLNSPQNHIGQEFLQTKHKHMHKYKHTQQKITSFLTFPWKPPQSNFPQHSHTLTPTITFSEGLSLPHSMHTHYFHTLRTHLNYFYTLRTHTTSTLYAHILTTSTLYAHTLLPHSTHTS